MAAAAVDGPIRPAAHVAGVSVGLLGPVLLMLEYAIRFHLGLSTPRALLAMTASGYLSPAIAACLTLITASAVQIVAIIAGRVRTCASAASAV